MALLCWDSISDQRFSGRLRSPFSLFLLLFVTVS